MFVVGVGNVKLEIKNVKYDRCCVCIRAHATTVIFYILNSNNCLQQLFAINLLNMKQFLLLSIIHFPFFLFSQSLKITNGTETETLSNDSFYKLSTGLKEDSKCYDCIKIEGLINGSSTDSIVFALKSIERNFTKTKVVSSIDFETLHLNSNSWTVLKSDIHLVEVFKSAKSEKKFRNRRIWGGLLIFTGIATAASSLLVEKGNSRKSLLIAAGIEGVLGFGLSIPFGKKTYKFFGSDSWEFK